MPNDFNPYAAPQTTDIRDKPTDDESVRREYLSHEASVQSIGSLYVIATVVLALLLITTVSDSARIAVAGIYNLVFFGCLLLLCGFTAYGLLRLKRWARIVASVLAVPGLLVVPLGTLINAYVLYLLLSRKSGFIFSDEYRRIINATPHIKYRTSRLVWLFLIMIVVLLVIGVVAAIFLA